MKICFISSYPPDKEGVGVYTKRLVDKLEKNNIDTTILTFKNNLNQDNKIKQVLSANPINIFRTYNALKKIDFDIIHIQYAISIYRFYSLVLWIILGLFKMVNKNKMVVTFHEIKREIDSLKLIGKIYYKII